MRARDIKTAPGNESYVDRLRSDLSARFSSPIPYSICVCATLIASIIGPFGTYESADYPTLLIYWGGLICWAAFSSIVLSSVVGTSMNSPSILTTVISTVLFTATYVPFLIWFREAFGPGDLAGRPTEMQLAFFVLLITSAISGLVYQIERHVKPPQSQTPRIWRRLPDAEIADIIRLSSEGHFICVHATNGVYRLRLRFADAVSEMDGVKGACVHRSHWVARKHVVCATEKNNRPILVMSDGAEIPVSRKYRHEAERMGLIPAERKQRTLEMS